MLKEIENRQAKDADKNARPKTPKDIGEQQHIPGYGLESKNFPGANAENGRIDQGTNAGGTYAAQP